MKTIITRFKKVWTHFINKPLSISVLISFILGLMPALCTYISTRINLGDYKYFIKDFVQIAVIGALIGFFLIYPLLLSVINFLILFFPKKRFRSIEYVTILWGAFCTILYISISDIVFSSDWTEQLYNAQKHTPIYTQAFVTVIVLVCAGLIGYAVLNFVPLKKLPPLVVVLCISALYIGAAEAALWGIQVWGEWLLTLYPANCLLVFAKLMLCKMREWGELQTQIVAEYAKVHGQAATQAQEAPYKNAFLGACHRFLMKSSHWPAAALILTLPLLGILIAVLTLFGQQPDAFISAWTQTSDWALSMQTAPQNLYVDEHYLCTVAAGGHRRVVKPLRMGERHGHAVIVNRQLCIANAFEQLLEEHTPRLHRHIRHFYDTCGFPIAKLIHSPYAADAVYFLMKPLEWLFLIVLYLCDVRPENRIAVQYLPKRADKKNL